MTTTITMQCKTCALLPKLLGKSFLLPLFGHKYRKLSWNEVAPYFIGLQLEVVGGLRIRGWTMHDVDVIGAKKDIFVLAERMQKKGIQNPIHYCGSKTHHSHIACAWYGIKLTLTGKGY